MKRQLNTASFIYLFSFFLQYTVYQLDPIFLFWVFPTGSARQIWQQPCNITALYHKKTQSFIYLSIIGHISSTACNYYLLQLGSIYGELSWSGGEQWVCNLKDLQAAHKITVMDEKII